MGRVREISGSLLTVMAMTIVLMMAGCSGDPLSGTAGAIEQGKTKWEKAGLDNYSFLYKHGCFCSSPEDVKPVIVIVRKDTVADVLFADTRMPVERKRLSEFRTIDGLFATLRDAVARNAHTITATYDPGLGYPATAWIDYVENVADEEISFSVDSLQVLP